MLSDGIRWAVLGGQGGGLACFEQNVRESGVLTAVLKAKRKA